MIATIRLKKSFGAVSAFVNHVMKTYKRIWAVHGNTTFHECISTLFIFLNLFFTSPNPAYRCNSPIEILLQLTMTNLNIFTNTRNVVLNALNAEMADGILSDPLATENVNNITVVASGEHIKNNNLESKLDYALRSC